MCEMKKKKKKIHDIAMMWLNWSAVTINATLQHLDIYRLVNFLRVYIIKLLLYENILLKNYPSNTWFE